jgi:hypothetical protein
MGYERLWQLNRCDRVSMNRGKWGCVMTYIAQHASTIPTVHFLRLFICSLCTMKIGTMLNVQSVTQLSAEYP